MTGIDISNYQSGLNLAVAKEQGISFVICKITEGRTYFDKAFDAFYQQAQSAQLPMGAYVYTHALTPEVALAEAEVALQRLNGRKLQLGIFIDVEKSEHMSIPSSQLYLTIQAFCQRVEAAGYLSGIYGSEYNLWSRVRPEQFPNSLIWVAYYGAQPAFPCDIWQKTDQGRIAGYNGNLDTDLAMSSKFEAIVNDKPVEEKPVFKPNDLLKPGVLFPPNPTVVALQLWLNHDLNSYGIETPVDGQKTARFYADFDNFIENESDKMSTATVLAYQLWLTYNGYAVPVDGKKTQQFLNVLREFSRDMRTC